MFQLPQKSERRSTLRSHTGVVIQVFQVIGKDFSSIRRALMLKMLERGDLPESASSGLCADAKQASAYSCTSTV